jgi:hypothetical protein
MADKEQRRYLQIALANAKNDLKSFKPEPKPKSIRHMERIVDRWHKQQRNREYRLIHRIDTAARKINEMILFGDPQKALAAIRAFAHSLRENFNEREI